MAVILVPVFNDARGSILIPMLYHFQLNNPLWPDGQPLDMFLFALLAVVVVTLNRKRMLRKSDWAVMRVIPADLPSFHPVKDRTA